MIISVHQPHFLPWLGYFNKIACSDVFVWLEDVQFRKNYFQNRTKIKGNKEELWLTLPVKKVKLDASIKEIELLKSREYQKITKTIKNYYSKAPFFNTYFKEIESIINNCNNSLNDINFELFKYIVNVLKLDTKIIKSTSLNLIELEANNRLIEICSKLKATKYIAGKGSKNYMNQNQFQQNDIEILWQDFPVNQIEYRQTKGDFIYGLSILDALFNIGAEKTKELVLTSWTN